MIASDVLPIVIQQNRKKEKNTFESLRIREKKMISQRGFRFPSISLSNFFCC